MTHNIQENDFTEIARKNTQLKNQPIGIFDSGVGGLTVVSELIRQIPEESFVYFGDTARVPYGTKSPETILKMARDNVRFLKQFDIKLLVIACHSACCIGEAVLREDEKDLFVLGVIEPGVASGIAQTRNGRIGLIGTNATVQSESYQTAIRRMAPEVKLTSLATPLFVPLVEEGWIQGDITRQIVQRYLEPLRRENIDTLILGCTHYPLLKAVIQDVMGPDVHLVDSAEEAIKKLHVYLKQNDLLADQAPARHHYYVSDDPLKFQRLGSLFLPNNLTRIKKISW